MSSVAGLENPPCDILTLFPYVSPSFFFPWFSLNSTSYLPHPFKPLPFYLLPPSDPAHVLPNGQQTTTRWTSNTNAPMETANSNFITTVRHHTSLLHDANSRTLHPPKVGTIDIVLTPQESFLWNNKGDCPQRTEKWKQDTVDVDRVGEKKLYW